MDCAASHLISAVSPTDARVGETIGGMSSDQPAVITDREHTQGDSARLSIVVPVFNTPGSFLREAVMSAARQTLPVDVVMVDDGSTKPDTLQAEVELERLPGVRLVKHDQNGGVAAAINTGISVAFAPYVLAMGSDDILEPTYAALAADVLDQRPDVAIVTTDIQRFGASDAVDVATGAPNGVRDMLFHNVISGASVCRKTDWEAVGGYAPLQWGEDYDFWIRVLARGGVCVRLDSIQYYYRIHEGQATQTLTAEEKASDRLEVVRRNKDVFADHLDLVMTHLWQQEESLAYFKRRYGRLNDLKSKVTAHGRRAQAVLSSRTRAR